MVTLYNNNKQYYMNLIKGGAIDEKQRINKTNEYLTSMLNDGYTFQETKDMRRYIIQNSEGGSSIEIIYNEFGDIEKYIGDVIRIFKSDIIFQTLSNKVFARIQDEFKNIIKSVRLFMRNKKNI